MEIKSKKRRLTKMTNIENFCKDCPAWSGSDCTRNPYTEGCLKDEQNEMKRREIKIDNKLNECLDILAKMEFFNQRAGRELWFDKPKNIQDEDIENFNRDINTLREYILKQEKIK